MNQLANQSGRSASAFRDEQSLTRRVAGRRRARYSTSIAPACQRADFDHASVAPSPQARPAAAAAAADRVITTRVVLSVGRRLTAQRFLMCGRHEFIQ